MIGGCGSSGSESWSCFISRRFCKRVIAEVLVGRRGELSIFVIFDREEILGYNTKFIDAFWNLRLVFLVKFFCGKASMCRGSRR